MVIVDSGKSVQHLANLFIDCAYSASLYKVALCGARYSEHKEFTPPNHHL